MSMTVSVWAQEYKIDPDQIYRSRFRAILNHFSLTVSSGYNRTSYKHDLTGYYYLQSSNQQLITSDLDTPLNGAYANWFNAPVFADSTAVSVFNPPLDSSVSIYDLDSSELNFKGKSWSIPLNIRIRYNYKNFRIGFGFNMEYHKVNALQSNLSDLGVRDYQPNFKSAFLMRYYGMLGYKFLDFWDYSFAGEVEVGKTIMGKNFNKSLIDNRVFFNLGLSLEKNISEYLRVVVRPSYEFKSYDISLPGTSNTISHRNPAFNLNVGLSVTFPEIPRSPIKSDHVQLKHVVIDPDKQRYAEVRGQRIWKRQNPKVGENHRRLWRYKLKNRWKDNPY